MTGLKEVYGPRYHRAGSGKLVRRLPGEGRAEKRNMQFGRAPRGNFQRPLAKNVANVARASGRRPEEWPAYSPADEYAAACFEMKAAGK